MQSPGVPTANGTSDAQGSIVEEMLPIQRDKVVHLGFPGGGNHEYVILIVENLAAFRPGGLVWRAKDLHTAGIQDERQITQLFR